MAGEGKVDSIQSNPNPSLTGSFNESSPTPTARGIVPQPNVFAWQEIECRVQDRADKTRELTLLDSIWGAAQTGDLVAIIGA